MASAAAKKVLNPFGPPPDDGLPPITKATYRYWNELCKVLEHHKGAGVQDGQWPPALAPSKLTLKQMVERGLIIRRKRAWHLKRDWRILLKWLGQQAIPTPLLQVVERPAKGLPTYAEMEAWEPILLWLDAQPKRRARLPFEGFDDVLVASHLASIRKYRLLRHAQGCWWILSPKWKDKLLSLWQGVTKAEGSRPLHAVQPKDPVSLVAGIDTWYLNRIDEAGLPAHLRRDLDEWQHQAKDELAEVETQWVFDDAPLKMYQGGVNAKQGGGSSWGYILRNKSLTLRIRRKPLGGIIAQAQFSSECLWRLTPLAALNQLDHFIKDMWGQTKGHWQNSQVHLCHDVMHASIEFEQLERYVSRSRSQAIFDAAKADITARLGEDVEIGQGIDWGEIYGGDDGFFLDPLLALDEGIELDLVRESVDDRQVTVYRYGRRLSGVAWSQGGDISLVQYVKTLEIQRTGKRHMVPLWQEHGYTGSEVVVRNEARLRRGAIRALKVKGCSRDALDDPWLFLHHLADVWALVVGRAEPCPDAIVIAWIRRVIPDVGDTNRSRWPTDPEWRVIQAATFQEPSQEARHLIREAQQTRDVQQRVKAMYGSLVSAIALLNPEAERLDISAAIRQVAPLLVAESEEPEKEFGGLVRERQHKLGLPVLHNAKILPFRPPQAHAEQPQPEVLDQDPPEGHFERAWWQLEQAERRMLEALDALDLARQQGASPQRLAELQTVYEYEALVRDAALAALEQGGVDTSAQPSA